MIPCIILLFSALHFHQGRAGVRQGFFKQWDESYNLRNAHQAPNLPLFSSGAHVEWVQTWGAAVTQHLMPAASAYVPSVGLTAAQFPSHALSLCSLATSRSSV